MRRPLVVGNWKMNGRLAANKGLLSEVIDGLKEATSVAVGLCPPYPYLAQVCEYLDGAKGLAVELSVGVQDVSAHPQDGAYTGEVSASMVADLGCRLAIVGHSERRAYHNEANEDVAEKFSAAVANGLTPILCVGETNDQRQAGLTLGLVGKQLQAVIDGSGIEAFRQAVIAYEPVWAIGTGLTASPEQAQEVHAFIRGQLGEVGTEVQILYGGSVKPGNAAELFAQSDIDGALVGGASLKAEDFLAICMAAEKA